VPGTVSAFYRLAVASVVLAVPFGRQMARRQVVLRPSVWLLAIVAGVFFALDIAVWNSSLLIIKAGPATLLGNNAPIFVGLGALLLFRERLGPMYWVGLVIALLGMVLVVGWDVVTDSQLGVGDFLAALGGVFYAGYLLTTQRLRVWMDTLSTLWIAGMTGVVMLLVFNLVTAQPMTGYPASSYLSLIALGLISQVVGWLAINYALGHMPASIVSVTLLGQPIVTAVLAWPLLHEVLSPLQALGGLVALAGIALVNRGVARGDQRQAQGE
jgi:drug/metabolite transporter (DMT)-like permease